MAFKVQAMHIKHKITSLSCIGKVVVGIDHFIRWKSLNVWLASITRRGFRGTISIERDSVNQQFVFNLSEQHRNPPINTWCVKLRKTSIFVPRVVQQEGEAFPLWVRDKNIKTKFQSHPIIYTTMTENIELNLTFQYFVA